MSDDASHPGGAGEYSRMEGALAESEARLRAILDTAVDGIITIDEHGIIESVNPAVERLFGYARDDLVGSNVSMLMPEPYHGEHDGYLAHYIETGDAKIIGIGRDVAGRRRDGTVFPIELAVSEVGVSGRRLFTGIVRDVSDRVNAEQRARVRLQDAAHAGRLLELGEMLSGLAHEVNQPLTAIVSFAEACLRLQRSGTGEPAIIEDALSQIAEQGQRAGAIISRLRQLGRKGEPNRERFDLNEAVHDVLALIDHEIRRHGVRVAIDLSADLPPIVGDRVLVEQVLLNLLRNAIEAMRETPDGARALHVSSRGTAGAAQLSVADTGRGLAENEIEQVFETFYTTKPEGVGVGLALSRSIIESHGGTLSARPSERGGAQFTFELPLHEAAEG